MQVLVTGFKSYSFTEKETNRHVCGTHLHYLDAAQPNEVGQVGLLPCKVSVPDSLAGGIISAPAIYEIEFATRPDGRGRPVVSLSKLQHIKAYSFAIKEPIKM